MPSCPATPSLGLPRPSSPPARAAGLERRDKLPCPAPPPDLGPSVPTATSTPAGHGRRLKACVRCSGDLFYDFVDEDWYCLQCGHVEYGRQAVEPDIPDAGERRRREYVCTIEGCDGLVHRCGLCVTHEYRLRKHGSPLWEPPRRVNKGGSAEGRAKWKAYSALFFERRSA